MKVEFFKHNIGPSEKQKVMECLDGIFLTTGSYVSEFETKFAAYVKTKYSVGLTSCTAALHLSLLALGIKEGDEVITTPMTFIATANAVLYTGATPVFVDVDKNTGLIDPALIEKAITSRTKAILPVHLYGQMADMKVIKKIADKHHLKVIEDAAHCIEGVRDDLRPGQFSDISCFSFYATKNITSGEGGAIATNHEDLAQKIRLLRSHGMSKQAADRYTSHYQHWDMEFLGWKYNMSNIQAALLLTQIDDIEGNCARREEICRKYESAFRNESNIQLLKIAANSKSARHLFTILVDPKRRDEILWKLQDLGIGVAVNYRAIHLLDYLQKRLGYSAGDFPHAEEIGLRTITLPMYPKLNDQEINYVIESVKKVVNAHA